MSAATELSALVRGAIRRRHVLGMTPLRDEAIVQFSDARVFVRPGGLLVVKWSAGAAEVLDGDDGLYAQAVKAVAELVQAVLEGEAGEREAPVSLQAARQLLALVMEAIESGTMPPSGDDIAAELGTVLADDDPLLETWAAHLRSVIPAASCT
jgi:hypothetical protein